MCDNVESPLPQRQPAKADEPSVSTGPVPHSTRRDAPCVLLNRYKTRCAQEECLLVSTSLSVRYCGADGYSSRLILLLSTARHYSSIALLQRNSSNNPLQSKHIAIGYYFVRDHVKSKKRRRTEKSDEFIQLSFIYFYGLISVV